MHLWKSTQVCFSDSSCNTHNWKLSLTLAEMNIKENVLTRQDAKFQPSRCTNTYNLIAIYTRIAPQDPQSNVAASDLQNTFDNPGLEVPMIESQTNETQAF